MKYLSTKKSNILLTILIAIISSLCIIYSGVLDNAGMAVIILIWIPTIIGLVTIIVFLLTTLMTKKYAPIVSIVGNILNLILGIGSFFN